MDGTTHLTEAYLRYKESCDRMDTYVKASAASFAAMEALTNGPSGPTVLGAFFGSSGERWQAVPKVHEPTTVLRLARNKSVALAVVGIHGDHEAGMTSLLTDCYEHWGDTFEPIGIVQARPTSQQSPLHLKGWNAVLSDHLRPVPSGQPFIDACYRLAGVALPTTSAELFPLYEYFRLCRNRVTHNESSAGQELAALSRSAALKKSIASLNEHLETKRKASRATQLATAKRKGTKAKDILRKARSTARPVPDVPEFRDAEDVILNPSHAILCKFVASRLVDDLMTAVAPKLGVDGFVRMAARHAYGPDPHPFRNRSHKMVVVPIKSFLASRYRFSGLTEDETIAKCRHLGLWDECVVRFKVLYRNP